jgi:hypothetical protein
MTDLTNGLRRQWNNRGDLWRAHPFGHLQQRYRPQHDSHGLDSSSQQFLQFIPVLFRDFDAQCGSGHTQVCAKTFSMGIVLLESFQMVKDLAT